MSRSRFLPWACHNRARLLPLVLLLAACPQAEDTDPDPGATPREDAVSPPFCPITEGIRELLVIPVQLGAEATGCTQDALQGTWFGRDDSVSAFFDAASAGRLTLGGTAVDLVTVPAVDGCIGLDIAENRALLEQIYGLVDDSYEASGAVIASDTIVVYALPDSIKCADNGQAAGTPPGFGRIFTYTSDACASVQVSAHEAGHAIGINHARRLLPSGEIGEYGDGSDVMGNSLFPPNGPHQAQLGWLSTDQVRTVEISEVGEGLSLALAPLGLDTSERVQLVRIKRPGTTSIYLSFRAPSDLDADLGVGFADRLSVHEFVEDCPTGLPVPTTLLVRTLGEGDVYPLPEQGLSIVLSGVDGDGATVALLPQ